MGFAGHRPRVTLYPPHVKPPFLQFKPAPVWSDSDACIFNTGRLGPGFTYRWDALHHIFSCVDGMSSILSWFCY